MPIEITREQMVEAKQWLKDHLKVLNDGHGILIEESDIDVLEAILAALEGSEKLIKAVKDYLEWGAMTGSDRDLHESRFLEALTALNVEVPNAD